jgi:hypothetical protein
MRMTIRIAALILLLAACRGERAERQETPDRETAAPATAAESRVPQKPDVVRSADGSELIAVTEADGTLEISFTEGGTKRTLHGETRDSGKRKYQLDGGPVLFEIKPGDDGGFKLRTADGALRWKVKIAPDKIKISDNEENENPFELKVREGDRVKVVAPGDREIGNVRFDRAASKTEIETAGGRTMFVVEGSRPSGAYGVLLLDSIPEVQRYILLAEIQSRGR